KARDGLTRSSTAGASRSTTAPPAKVNSATPAVSSNRPAGSLTPRSGGSGASHLQPAALVKVATPAAQLWPGPTASQHAIPTITSSEAATAAAAGQAGQPAGRFPAGAAFSG